MDDDEVTDDNDENLINEEVDTSDCESVSTIGYTRIEEKDRFDNLENEKKNEEVITIVDEPIEDNMENSNEDTEKEANGEEIMVIEDTEEANEIYDPREVSKRKDNPDGIQKPDEEGTQISPSKIS